MPRECSSWAALYEDLSSRVVQVLVVLAEEADGVEGLAVAKSYAALLCVNRHWRAVALQIPLCVRCAPSPKLLAWLRMVPLRHLEFLHGGSQGGAGDRYLGFQSAEQRYRAPVATLLGTLDFIKRVLGGVHPRPGILSLSPFTSLERLSMIGNPSEACRLEVLQGLPHLAHVEASGFGDYFFDGLPSPIAHLSLSWGTAAGQQFPQALIHVSLPVSTQLERLTLMAQRPMLLPGESLARCRHASISARRAYLGLPLRQDAPWADSSEICQRFAAFVLEGLLEEVEVQATRCIVFQPSAERYDLATSEGLGGQASSYELVSSLLHRHFQALHVEERAPAAAGERPWVRIMRRRSEPSGFYFPASPLSPEQCSFLQEEALATALSFAGGVVGGADHLPPPPRPAMVAAIRADTVAVLNHPAFAERCGGLLASLTNAVVWPELGLLPYTALAHMHAVWLGPPGAAVLPNLQCLKLTAAGGEANVSAGSLHFSSRWLEGASQLGSVVLARFATADLSCLRGRPSLSVVVQAMQPPSGVVSAETLALPHCGFGPDATLCLRVGAQPLAQQLLAQLHAQMAHAQQQQLQAQPAAVVVQPGQQEPIPQQAIVVELAGNPGLLAQQAPQQLAAGGVGAVAGPPQAVAAAAAPQQALLQDVVVQNIGGIAQAVAALAQQVGQAQQPGAEAGVVAAADQAVQAAAAALDAAVDMADVVAMDSDEEDEAVAVAGANLVGAQPWVVVPDAVAIPAAVIEGQGGWIPLAALPAGPLGPGIAPAPEPPLHPLHPAERLGDVTVQHAELLNAAGTVSIAGAAVRLRFAGADPGGLLRLLTAPSSSTGPSPLRCLRLTGSSLSFVACNSKEGGEMQEQSFTAAQLRDWLAASPWGETFEAKLSRGAFRHHESLTLSRRGPLPRR